MNSNPKRDRDQKPEPYTIAVDPPSLTQNATLLDGTSKVVMAAAVPSVAARPDPDRILLRFSQLPPAVQEFLTEMELLEGTPAASYILGYILHHLERGELSWKPSSVALESIYGPQVAEQLRGVPNDLTGQTTSCAWCGQPFMLSRVGQKFCPDPSPDEDRESCGKQATTAARIQAAAVRGDRRYGHSTPEHQRLRNFLDTNAHTDARGRVLPTKVPD